MNLAGAVVWGVVPFAAQAPFRIYAGDDHRPIEVPKSEPITNAGRKGGDVQYDFIVQAKARPVLILSDKHADDLGEYLALRLARFSKLTSEEQDSIRAQRHPTHFYLKPEKFSLPEESAAMVASLVRVHASALDSKLCGRLDEHELRIVQERFLRFHAFDLRSLLELAMEQMEARKKARPRP